jgi:hypothetical protein
VSVCMYCRTRTPVGAATAQSHVRLCMRSWKVAMQAAAAWSPSSGSNWQVSDEILSSQLCPTWSLWCKAQAVTRDVYATSLPVLILVGFQMQTKCD